MWLTKFLAKQRLKDLTERHQQLSPMHPNREACEQMVSELRPNYYRQYKPSQGRVECEFFYPNVEAYTTKLKEVNRTIKDGRPISVSWTDDVKMTRTTVDAFLVSNDGYYLNVQQAIDRFKIESFELCRLMRVADTASHGVHEHNLRMLTKLFINLRIVHQHLIEVSLTNV